MRAGIGPKGRYSSKLTQLGVPGPTTCAAGPFRRDRRPFRWCSIRIQHLLNDEIVWEAVDHNILETRFPAHLPTHSERHRFYFDPETHLLQRHDFIAEIVAPIARECHMRLDWRSQDGIPFRAKRRIRGRAGQRPHAPIVGPLIVWVDTHRFVLR